MNIQDNLSGNGKLILVVDDEESIRTVLTLTLEASGYKVLQAASTREALAIFTTTGTPIDLLITDIRMPGVDGLALVQAIKSRAPQVPIIVISGSPDRDHDQCFKMLGVAGLVLKPFSPDMILQMVNLAIHDRNLPYRRYEALGGYDSRIPHEPKELAEDDTVCPSQIQRGGRREAHVDNVLEEILAAYPQTRRALEAVFSLAPANLLAATNPATDGLLNHFIDQFSNKFC